MKKAITVLLLAAVAAGCFALCACKPAEHVHSWDSVVETVEATCKEDGHVTYSCSGCDKTKTEVLPKTEAHAFGGWTADGDKHVRACSTCGVEQRENHRYVDSVCADCGAKEGSAALTAVTGGEIDFDKLTVDMFVDHDVSQVRFGDIVTVSSGASWKLCNADNIELPTKFGNLSDGENTFYIVVQNSASKQSVYTVSVYKSFKVSVKYFDSLGRLLHTDQAYTGKAYALTYVPQISGYDFKHWTVEGKQAAVVIPLGDVEVKADCSPKSYVATLNANGGQADKTEQTVVYESGYSLPVPTRAHYSFGGWYVGTQRVTDTDGKSSYKWSFAENTELVARWIADEFRVTTVSEDYSRGSVDYAGMFGYETKVTVTARPNTCYELEGWYLDGVKVSGQASYTFTMPAENIELTDKWKIAKEFEILDFTVNYNSIVVNECLDKDVRELVIPDCVTMVKRGALAGCNSVEQLTLPNMDYSLNELYGAEEALSDSLVPQTIRQVTVLGGTGLAYGAFANCISLERVVLPDTLEYISERAFAGCGIYEIDVPAHVTRIRDSAFELCIFLTKITLPDGLREIGSRAFAPCAIAEIEIPASVNVIGANAFGPALVIYCQAAEQPSEWNSSWDEYADGNMRTHMSVVWDCLNGDREQTYKYAVIDGILYSLYDFGGGTNRFATVMGNVITDENANVVIPSVVSYDGTDYEVRSISDYAFCYGLLSSIAIPDSVTRIGTGAFKYSVIERVTGCGGVLNVGNGAFYGCYWLTDIQLGDKVQTIYSDAFYYCQRLESITLPASLTRINAKAFKGCSALTSAAFQGGKWLVTYGGRGHGVDLSDVGQAAVYLTQTYVDYEWEVY